MGIDIAGFAQKQLEGLKKFGESTFNPKEDKLATSYDASVFEGDLDNLKDTALSTVFSQDDLETVFSILDADGNGTLSSEEIQLLSSMGKGSTKKISNSDLKEFFSQASDFAKNTESTKDGLVTTEKAEDGSKTVTKTNADGTKEIVKYDKNGKKISKSTTAADGTVKNIKYKDGKKVSSETVGTDGTVKTTKFKYDKDGNVISSSSKKVDANGELISKTSTEYKDGKKDKAHTEYPDGTTAETSYKYNSAGKLANKKTVKSDNTVISWDYDIQTGNKKQKTTVRPDGRVSDRVTYDKDGKPTAKTSYKFDVNGKKTKSINYSYKNGKLSNRTVYDSEGKLISKGKYTYNEDGSRTRTDTDPSGKYIGERVSIYDEYGNIKFAYVDKDGDHEHDFGFGYDSRGNVTEKLKYETDSKNHTRTTYSDHDNDGKYDSVSYFQEDDQGRTVSTSFDHNNDGKIDEYLKFEYDSNGKMSGRYTDKDNDGFYDSYDVFDENGKIKSTKSVHQAYDK